MDQSDAGFTEFVSGSVNRLTRFAELFAGGPHRAPDLVQESLERAYIRWPKAQVEVPHAYVRQIIVNQYGTGGGGAGGTGTSSFGDILTRRFRDWLNFAEQS